MSKKKLSSEEHELITNSLKGSKVLLWSNPNPDVGIGAIESQPYGVNTESEIPLIYKLSDFESFRVVVFDNVTDSNPHVMCFEIVTGELIEQTLTNQVSDDVRDFNANNTSYGNAEWVRRLTLNENNFTLSNCHADGRDGEQTTNSDRLVPIVIWGYLK